MGASTSDAVIRGWRSHSFFVLFFSFNQDRTGKIFAAAGAVGMCVNGHACGAVGKPAAFPSGRECLFSISGAAVFHISIAQNGQRTLLSVAFPCRKMYNEHG